MIAHAVIDVCARCAFTDARVAIASAAPKSVIRIHDRQPGGIVVRVPLAIDGGGTGVIAATGSGSGIDVRADGVSVRNLEIRGFGGEDASGRTAALVLRSAKTHIEHVAFLENAFAISAIGARDVTIDDVSIQSNDPNGDPFRVWHSRSVTLEASSISGGRDVFLSWSPGVTIRTTRFTGLRYGLHDMFSPNVVVDRNTFEDCEIGTNFMYAQELRVTNNRFIHNSGPTGYGIGLEDTDNARIRGNLFVANHTAMHVIDSPATANGTLQISDNSFSENGSALSLQSDARAMTVTGNAFAGNIEQVQISGGASVPGIVWSAAGGGNYWSDYSGFARDGSRTGAVPYRPSSTFEQIADANPDLQIFRGSAVAAAIDFAARSLSTQAAPKFVDAHPLMIAPDGPFASGAPKPTPITTKDHGLFASLAALPLVAIAGSLFLLPRVARARSEALSVKPGAILEVRALVKRYERGCGIHGISARFEPGECVALWGPNGAGKTTLLRCILGQSSYGGTVVINGRERGNEDDSTIQRYLGYAPQHMPDFELPVSQLVRMLSRLRGADAHRVRETFEEFGLDIEDARHVSQLSGGLRQRLSVACALIGAPQLIVLDEPTAGLDRASRADLLRALSKLKAKGKTILFTSHLISDVRALADRVLVLEEGALISDRSIDAFEEMAS